MFVIMVRLDFFFANIYMNNDFAQAKRKTRLNTIFIIMIRKNDSRFDCCLDFAQYRAM